jgi:hypothetical protein
MRLFRWSAALLAVTFAAYLWLAPGYLEIEIPVARHTGGWGFWWESHRTQLAHIDEPGVLYVHRQVGTTSDTHHWKTEAEIFAYFDDQLRQRGWSAGVAGLKNPEAPESYLLGADNHKQYVRTGTRERSTVFVSVWPVSGGSEGTFFIALTTANPSLWRRVAEVFTD